MGGISRAGGCGLGLVVPPPRPGEGVGCAMAEGRFSADFGWVGVGGYLTKGGWVWAGKKSPPRGHKANLCSEGRAINIKLM